MSWSSGAAKPAAARPWVSLTATVTATSAANAKLARPRTGQHSCSTGLSWQSATPEKRRAGGSTPPLTATLTCADARFMIVNVTAMVLLVSFLGHQLQADESNA